MIVSTSTRLTRELTRLTVLFFLIALGVVASTSIAHSKPTAKPSFNAAAKGTKPSYTQPKPVLRPPTSRPRNVHTTPTARKMHTQQSPVKAASRAKTNTATARNLRKSAATPGKSRPAKPIMAVSKSRIAGSKGGLRNAIGRKQGTGIGRPANSSRASRPTLRSNIRSATPKNQKKAQLGRAVGATKVSRNTGTRLTRAGKPSTHGRSSATRGPHASTTKVKNNNRAKRSLALKRGSKATTGLENRGHRPAPGERTIQGQVAAATKAGNPTIRRGGQDLFRLRSSGHGQVGASATPQNVRRQASNGRAFTGKGPDRPVNARDIRELFKAQIGHGTSTLRTRSGRE